MGHIQKYTKMGQGDFTNILNIFYVMIFDSDGNFTLILPVILNLLFHAQQEILSLMMTTSPELEFIRPH